MTTTTTFQTSAESPLPLTTTFTPASECLNDFWVLHSGWSTGSRYWANLGPDNLEKCLPSGWDASTYYSPGIACPSGWALAATALSAGETIGTCCPIYQPSSWTFTARSRKGKPWHDFEVCKFQATADMEYTYTHTNTPFVTTTALGSMKSGVGAWNAFGVELRWKSTDLRSVPATAVVSPTISGTATATPTTTTRQSSQESPGLSTGAKAGIGVGAALGGILVILVAAYLILCWRRRQGQKANDLTSALVQGQERHDLAASKHGAHEINSNPLHEKDGSQDANPQLREPAELEVQITR